MADSTRAAPAPNDSERRLHSSAEDCPSAKESGAGQTLARTRRVACEVAWLGLVDYQDAWALQRDLAAQRATGKIPDTVLLLEHPPVYTTGKRNTGAHLRLPERALGAPLIVSDRGGDITFHGPGQLIAYPILDLRAACLGVATYVRNLEEVIMRTLRDYGIESVVECGLTGVWVPPRPAAGTADRPSPVRGRGLRRRLAVARDVGEANEKIAAIGVRVSRLGGASGAWVTTHGMALNVDVDLAWFDRIVPCGIAGRGVTSMQRLLSKAPPMADVAESLTRHFGEVFEREIRRITHPPEVHARGLIGA